MWWTDRQTTDNNILTGLTLGDITLRLIGQPGQFSNSSELLSQTNLYVSFRKIWSNLRNYADDKVKKRYFQQLTKKKKKKKI